MHLPSEKIKLYSVIFCINKLAFAVFRQNKNLQQNKDRWKKNKKSERSRHLKGGDTNHKTKLGEKKETQGVRG